MDKRRHMRQASDEIEELFADLWQVFPFSRGLRRGYRPQVDVFRSHEPPSVTILVELPGVDPERVSVIAAPRALVIAGERRRPENCGHYEQMEIEYGPFERKVLLAEDVDPNDARATYERGILRIVFGVAARSAPRESVPIPVRTAR